MIETLISESGLPTCSINGTLLHSRYNPENEARRFVERTLGYTGKAGNNPCAILLLGESLGYLARAARESFPRAKIVAVFYSSACCASRAIPSVSIWDPLKGEPLLDFLENAISELDFDGLAVCEWPPSKRACPEMSMLANNTLTRFLQRLRGNILTTQAMGRLWIRNSVSNFVNISDVLKAPGADNGKVTVIAGSGPSIEESVSIIAEARENITLVALPSAMDHLLANGVYPDIIVMTDPGYLSGAHLAPAKHSNVLLVMPLSASRGALRLANASVYYLEQPYFFETELLARGGIRALRIPPAGTVAATSLIFALSVTAGEVVCTGLDFAYKDIKSHARPHTFLRLAEIKATRLAPQYSIAFEHAMRFADIPLGRSGWRTSNALVSYADWFSSLDGEVSGRVHQLLPSESGLNRIQAIGAPAFLDLVRFKGGLQGAKTLPAKIRLTRAERIKIALSVLSEWESELTHAAKAISRRSESVILSNRVTDLLYFFDPRAFRVIYQKARMTLDRQTGEELSELFKDALGFVSLIRNRFTETGCTEQEEWR